MTAQLSPTPVQKFFDNNGFPLFNGQLFTYAAGTTTPQATYVDSTQTTQNTNPIILNARGECNLWLDPTKSYKLVLQDAFGNTIWTVDNYANPGNAPSAVVDSGTLNNVVLTVPLLGTPQANSVVFFKAANTNTGPVTMTVNGQAKPLTWQNLAGFNGGEIQANGWYVAAFDGTQWQLQGPSLQPPQMRTAAEIAAGVTPTNYAYAPGDVRRYGADPTGTSASDTALSNAIAVCGTAGGTIRAPAGTYKFASAINLNQKTSIVIQGDGAATGGASPATVFQYTGTGSGVWITMNSSVGVQFRGIQFVHTQASFTGTYIQCNNDGSHGDPHDCGLFDCTLGQNVGTGTIHLDLNKCIIFTAERCEFSYGNPSVKLAQSGGYSNVIRFRDCTWASNYVAPVQNIGAAAQAILFEGCTFENLTNNTGAAVLSAASSAIFDGISFHGCWFGDVTSTSACSWIDIYGAGLVFTGNYISGNQTGTTGITLRQFAGSKILGNTPVSLLNFVNFAVANCLNAEISGNPANNVTNFVANGNNVPTGSLIWYSNFGISNPPSSNHGAFGNNGCRVNADGTIEQWGSASVTIGTPLSVTFATNGLAFPNACWQVVCGFGTFPGTDTVGATSISATGFTISTGGTAGTATVYWRALGN
jgi:hypothetical protein